MNTLEFSPSRFPLGSRVRSYDFEGNTRSYCEGELIGYVKFEGCLCYHIRVTLRLWSGKVLKAHETYVWPPVNGTPSMGGNLCGVVLLEPTFHSWLDSHIAEQAAHYNVTPERLGGIMHAAAEEQREREIAPWKFDEIEN